MFGRAPGSLIDENGKPAFGVYGEPILDLNLSGFDYRAVAPFPLNLSGRASLLAIKKWEYIGFVSKSLVLGVAVVDISFIAKFFAYLYLREEKSLLDLSELDIARSHSAMSSSSVSGVSFFKKGKTDVRIENDIDKGPRRVVIKHGKELEAEFTLDETGVTPLCLVSQNGMRGFNYTHKAAGLPVKGFVRHAGREFDLESDGAMGVLDWTAGCPARYTFWNWASASGVLDDGRRLGLNLSSGVNDRGFTENAYWVDGRPEKVDNMLFDYDPKALLSPWRISSNDGKVDLVFHPENERWENTNLVLLSSKFHQPFGRFEGTLLIEGKKKRIELFGFTEEHEAKW